MTHAKHLITRVRRTGCDQPHVRGRARGCVGAAMGVRLNLSAHLAERHGVHGGEVPNDFVHMCMCVWGVATQTA
jgi:hypothetical protein